MKPPIINFEGYPSPTRRIAVGDAAAAIPAAYIRPDTRNAVAALLTVEDNNIRVAFDGTVPTNANGTSADTGHLIYAGQAWRISNPKALSTLQYINAVAGNAAVIQLTLEFEV